MYIAWGQLALVLVVGLVVGAGLVSVFALGIAGLARLKEDREKGDRGKVGAASTARPWQRRGVRLGGVGACFGVCAGGVVYGIYLLVPQFH